MKKRLSSWQLAKMALEQYVVAGSFILKIIGIKQADASIHISYIERGIFIFLILAAFSEITIAVPALESFKHLKRRHLIMVSNR
ncbi:MAG: hypothetical protein ABF649_10260 [Bacillus sp. (in: firmicutes)]